MKRSTRTRTMSAPLLAAVLLSLLLAAGCRDGDQQAAGGAQPAPERATADKGQAPYYYGLIEEYQNVLAGDPHNLAATIALGNALYDAGQWKEAIGYYEQALKINPHIADVVTDMGTCYRNLGMPERAIALYQRALTIEPVHQNALFNLGVVYGLEVKDYAKAIKYWEQLLHVAPKHPKAEYLQASLAKLKKALREKNR